MFVIGITGLSCSGKTTLSEQLRDALGKDDCILLSMDDYYKELTEEQSKILYDDNAEINFDTPDAIDFDQMNSHLKSIINGVPVDIPRFDLGSCVVTRKDHVPAGRFKYIILEGVFIFCDQRISDLCNVRIWTEAGEYLCALRRFIKYTRDIQGYTADFVYNQCVKFVIPGQEKYIKPCKILCDLIYNGEKKEAIYVDMLVHFIKQKQLAQTA